MEKSSTIITIIDDVKQLETHPALYQIRKQYKTVKFCTTLNEGVGFIKENLEKKMVIVLDYQLSSAEKGNMAIREIRNISHLIPVIFWTANTISEVDEILNEKAFAVVYKKSPINTLVDKVKEAENELKFTVEGALEEYIKNHEKRKSETPFLISLNGQSYTLNDILKELRMQTDFGKNFEKDLISLAIDLLVRKKRNLND